jgi:phytoene/squalene synthetase
MMAVMEFDAERRGRLISHAELTEYSRMLATAVTDAMYYFIGHDDPAPHHEARYLAVTASHITHMLRDTLEDIEAGYLNIPGEYLQMHRISQLNVTGPAYRRWVCGRVKLARKYFKQGREYLAQDQNLRRRMAGHVYTARFEWMLRTIEGDNYCLRSEYPERKSLWAGLWMGWSAMVSMLASPLKNAGACNLATQPKRIIEP